MQIREKLFQKCIIFGTLSGVIIGVVVAYFSLRINFVSFSLQNVVLYSLYHAALYAIVGLLFGILVFFLFLILNRLGMDFLGQNQIFFIIPFVLLIGFFSARLVKNHARQIEKNKIEYDFNFESAEQMNGASVSDSVGFVEQGPKMKLLVFAVDAASHNMLDTLIAADRLPTFARLFNNGVRGRLKTIKPTRSPVIWTSIATSKTPDEHRIWDFVLSKLPGTSFTRGRFKYPEGSELNRFSDIFRSLNIVPFIPYTSNQRKVKAFWNILSDYGRKLGVIGWYTTFPAEPVNGFLLSDALFYSTRYQGDKSNSLLTYPPLLFSTLKDSIFDYEELPNEELVSIFQLSPETWKSMQASQHFDNMSYLMRETYTKDENTFRLARKMLSEIGLDDLDMAVVYFKQLDEISHAACEENWDDKLPESENYAICWESVTAAYQHVDNWMGKILEQVGEDVAVMLISDHGFDYGKIFGESKIAHWEAQEGVFALSGPNIKKGVEISDVTIMDFLPTALYIQNLPVAVDFKGQVVLDAFTDKFLDAYPVQYISSYEDGEFLTDNPVEMEFNKDIEKKLKSLGYLK